MKKLYAKWNENFEVVETSKEETLEHNHLLVENPTWEVSDWSEDGVNYILADRLTKLFDEMCQRTGMKSKDLAARIGKTECTFSRYRNGGSVVPVLVWNEVYRIEQFLKK